MHEKPYSTRPEPTIRVFSDFDGTVTDADIGDALLRDFCGEQLFAEVLRQWHDGACTAIEAYRRMFSAISHLTPSMLDEWLQVYSLDPSFARFVDWCARQAYPLMILSDGFDAYIHRMLESENLAVPFRANRLSLGDGAPHVDFPYADQRCPQHANCKSNHMLLHSQEEDLLVYIGDGTSDFDAAQYADLVFARGVLEHWCQEQNITFRRFYSFTTVREVLSELVDRRALRPGKRARVLRRQLWSTG
jgi:2-hydroxy-3-keto-5-methylthiopentenyl-1-phosphate phosphatase